MNEDAKKVALRMIPSGCYVLTAELDGDVCAATVTWATQCSFSPPLLAIGLKKDSGAHKMIPKSGNFALNMLGKDGKDVAYAFFRPAEKEGDAINGQKISASPGGAPLLESAAAWLECKMVQLVGAGDHDILVGEVVEAGVQSTITGRPDSAILTLSDLGDKVFYGG